MLFSFLPSDSALFFVYLAQKVVTLLILKSKQQTQ